MHSCIVQTVTELFSVARNFDVCFTDRDYRLRSPPTRLPILNGTPEQKQRVSLHCRRNFDKGFDYLTLSPLTVAQFALNN